MTTRRTGLITALILTAALFLSLPGLMRSFIPADLNRMHESLRPPRMRTLTVWLLPGETDDRKLISRACAAFEQAHEGVRIFLRVVTADEFAAPDAVLPDVALYDTGSLNIPEKVFVPLADAAESSGMFAGVSYGAPLWLSPNVLSLPASWLNVQAEPQPRAQSLLAAATPEPAPDQRAVLTPQELPWNRLLKPGSIAPSQGVALSQLLCMCPYSLRSALPAAVLAQTQPDCARVQTLAQHLAAVQKGETLIGCALTPAVSDRVRYASLCREGEDARAFVHFLRTGLADEALSLGLIPLGGQDASAAEPLTRQALGLFGLSHTLPNAYAHTRAELLSLCREGFERSSDPVETLLRLR